MTLRFRWFSAAVALVTLTSLARADGRQPYEITSTIPSLMDGQLLRTFMFDRTSQQLVAGNTVGIYEADLSSAKPKVNGPLAHGIITALDVAPDLGRIFFTAVDRVGYVSERGGPAVTMSTQTAWDVVYEPTQHEAYVAFEHSPDVAVFDAVTGKLKTRIRVPGWNAFQLEAIPGTVFMELGGEDGIYTIDAKTHTVARFEVKGSFITPGELQVDPNGQYLFMARPREIDAVSLSSHAVIGRVPMFGNPSIGWDPDSRVLIASWPAATKAWDMLMVYRPGPAGLTLLTTLKNERAGTTGIFRTNRGFLQLGDLQYLVWSATRAAVRP